MRCRYIHASLVTQVPSQANGYLALNSNIIPDDGMAMSIEEQIQPQADQDITYDGDSDDGKLSSAQDTKPFD